MLQITTEDGVRVLTLDRPDARNALHVPLLQALCAALDAAFEEQAVRALVLTGNGKSFSAGADLNEWAAAEAAGQLAAYGWTDMAHALIVALHAFPKPTIALLNGAAVGAGLDLALACDFRFAADDARFSCAYTKMAYPPDAGGTWLLPRLLGIEAAKRFVFTGEFWHAQEALAHGLVSEIHRPAALRAAGMAFARSLAAGPTLALREAKALIDSSLDRDLKAQLAAEREAGLRCGHTEDAREALAAAMERRPPLFRGK